MYGDILTSQTKHARRNRNRKIIGFNSPYRLSVKTNIGKIFVKLVKKHFPRTYKFDKIFNLNTIRISYSSNFNVKNFSNSKIWRFWDMSKIQRSCNYRIKEVFLWMVNVYTYLWYSRHTSPPILPTRNIMEPQRVSSNLDTITTRNL